MESGLVKPPTTATTLFGLLDPLSIRRGILRYRHMLELPSDFQDDDKTLWGTKMSDIDALKKEKQELIDKMLEMQKQFIEHEQEHGISGKDYWASTEGLLVDYRLQYMDMANRVVDLAHQIVGSTR